MREQTLSHYAAFTDAKAQRFDIQLMLKAVEHLVANRSVIPQVDQRHTFGADSFMP
jgi:hypothetical protein